MYIFIYLYYFNGWKLIWATSIQSIKNIEVVIKKIIGYGITITIIGWLNKKIK